MSKAKKCDWCGEGISATEDRVRLPSADASWSQTYHADCYCRVFAARCLRALATDDFDGPSLGRSLAEVLRALDPAHEEEDA
jgi:hypothetical protein